MKYLQLLAFSILLFPICSVYGQDRLSAISGSVTDESGAGVGGAQIRAKHLSTGRVRSINTDAEGRYSLQRLELGAYQVEAEREGFKLSRYENVVLEVDRAAVLRHKLVVGNRTESIVVTEAAQLIEATPSALTSLVDAATIDQLPLNGRDFMQLAAVQAGTPIARATDRDVDTGYGLQISISGSRPFQNSFRLDGLNFTTYNGSTPGSINGVNLGVDAISEFSVHSSTYSAQYGQAGGGIINAVTRSGGNEFHGTAFYFHRNDNLDARNFFDGAVAPEFKRNQYGASVGGPILKNRTFFFGNFEGFREARGNSTINTTLSAEARRGNLVSGTVAVHPAMVKVLDLYPLPNGAVFGDSGEYRFTNDTVGKQDFVTSRLDHNFGDYDKLFFRYTRDVGVQSNFTNYAAGTRQSSTRNHSAVLEHSHIFSPRLLNNARVGFLRTKTLDGATISQIPGTDDPALAFTPGSGVIGLIIVAGLSEFPGGSGAANHDQHIINSYQFSNDVSYVNGRHTLKAGGRLERTHFNTDSRNRQFGDFRFRTLSDFVRNIPDRFRGQLPQSDTIRGHRQWISGLYVQDTWRVSSRVMVDFGVRWETATVPTEVNGKLSNLDRLTDTEMRVGDPLFANPSLRNFVPRAGVAWDIFGKGKTLLRGGFGLFPDLILSPYISFSGVRNPPFFIRGETRTLTQGALPSGGYQALLRSATLDLTVERIPFDLEQPMVGQWNVNLEQTLSAHSSVRLAYVGSAGANLSSLVSDANLAPSTVAADGRLFFPAGGQVINRQFGQIRNRRFDAESSYHGLQSWFNHRLSNGFQMQLTYTFAKSIDDSSNFFSSSESSNRGLLPIDGSPRFNRGLSGHDVRHSVNLTGFWELPLRGAGRWKPLVEGWQLGGIATTATGTPTTVWLGYDAARTMSHQALSSLGQRPDLAPGFSRNAVTGDPARWVDINAFRRPQPGYLGNLGRNTITGPGLANVDFSVVKRTKMAWVGEGATLDFRVEFFNVLNKTNFDLPTLERMESLYQTTVREDFSRITSSAESREIQFGLKLRF